MANQQQLRNQIKKQKDIIDELKSQIDIHNTAQSHLQLLNIKYANQIKSLNNHINTYNSNRDSVESTNPTMPSINAPRLKLIKQVKILQTKIKNKNTRIAALNNALPVVNLHMDGKIQELKFLPLRQKVSKFIDMTKESLSKINMNQIGNINEITGKLSNMVSNINEDDYEEGEEDEEDDDEEGQEDDDEDGEEDDDEEGEECEDDEEDADEEDTEETPEETTEEAAEETTD